MSRALVRCALALALAGAFAGCAPVVVGGVVIGTGLFVSDRRTSGAQVEEQSIEFKASSRVSDLATLGQISVTSYNGIVLITGQVPGPNEKAQVEKAVAGIEKVRTVFNELEVGPSASLSARSNDSFLSGKIKATLVDAKDLQSNAYKVVVERGVAYLMGRVTEREAARGIDVARSVPGIQKVVRVFEILSEEELARLGTAPAPTPVAPAPAPAAASAVPAPAAAASAP
jgi:osmotically-inducible protein OsmY